MSKKAEVQINEVVADIATQFEENYPRRVVDFINDDFIVQIRTPPCLPEFIERRNIDAFRKFKVCPFICEVKSCDSIADVDLIDSLCQRLFAIPSVEAIVISSHTNENFLPRFVLDNRWQTLINREMKALGMSGQTDCYFILRQDFELKVTS